MKLSKQQQVMTAMQLGRNELEIVLVEEDMDMDKAVMLLCYDRWVGVVVGLKGCQFMAY